MIKTKQELDYSKISDYLTSNDMDYYEYCKRLKLQLPIEYRIKQAKKKIYENDLLENGVRYIQSRKFFKILDEFHLISMKKPTFDKKKSENIGNTNSKWSAFLCCKTNKRGGNYEWIFPLDDVEDFILEINANRFS